MTFDIHPEATEEIRDAISYLDTDPPGKGSEFREAAYTTISFVCRFPNVGTRRKNGARTRRIQGFEYLIAYVELDNVILVVAVYSGRRMPDYWESRMPQGK